MSTRRVRIIATVRVTRTNPTPSEARLDAETQQKIQALLDMDLGARATALEALLNLPGATL